MAMAAQLLYVPITAFTKVSTLLTYLRIFPSRTNKYFCYFFIAYTIPWAIVSFCMALFQCRPIESFWYIYKYPDRKCMNIMVLYYVSGGLNIFSDFLIYLWPAKDLAAVQISLKQRVMLISMFSMGIVICVAGVLRLYYCYVYINSYDILCKLILCAAIVALPWLMQFPGHGSVLYVIISVETSIGICCGCLPSCKPLLSKLAPRIFTSTTNSNNRSARKKASNVDGQPFPFHSLSGGIVKGEEFSIEYDDKSSAGRSMGRKDGLRVQTSTRGQSEWNAETQEGHVWIMLQDQRLTATPAIKVDGPDHA
jgi:hypothetical protein